MKASLAAIRHWTSNPSSESHLPPPTLRTAVDSSRWKKHCKDLVLWVEDSLHLRRQAYWRARHIERIVTKEGCDSIVACSGDVLDLPAAYHAARWAKVPFYAYMFDDYATHFTASFQREYARTMMPRMLRIAAGVVVPNEFLARSYRQQYGIEPCIIRNPIEEGLRAFSPPKAMGVPRIVYTGSIYEAHFDAFHRLIAATELLRPAKVELHLYTPNDPRYLERHGIGAPAIVHSAVSASDAVRLQQEADIVVLPLAFDSPIPEIIATSAPGKMGELLASGRPILVHAPRDSFLSWYFRTHECGEVVDERDPGLLAQALERLLRDPDYCKRLVTRALKRVECDFSLNAARSRFFGMLQGGPSSFMQARHEWDAA